MTKAQRGGHKAFVTKIIGEAQTLLTSYEEKDTARIKTLIGTLCDKGEIIKTFDSQILGKLTVDAEIEEEIMTSSEYHRVIAETVMGLNEALDKLSGKAAGGVEKKPDISSGRDHEHTKLPRITVGKFNGDYLKFQEWWETYNAAVHSNTSINDAMKFNYLRGYLEGTAASTISGIALSAENYTEAIELLKSRFGNKQALISAHVDKFLSLPDDVQSDDVKELREMYDTIEVNVRSLKSLKVLTDQLGPVLVQIVMKKLPEDIQLMVSRHMMMKMSMSDSASGESSDAGVGWKIDELIQFVKQEIESREMCYMVSSKSPVNEGNRSKKNHYNNLHSGAKNPKVSSGCVYCNSKKHPSHRCDTVTDARSRKSILRRKGRCFICLRSGHISSKCDVQYKCVKCQGRHNISICEEQKQADKEDDDKSEDADVENTTACVAVSKTTRITFLQTAKATASNPQASVEANVRVIFDPCAQKSFITKQSRDLLGLKTLRREAMIVDGFAGKESSVKNQEIVKANIASVSGDFKKEIELFVVPIICSPVHNQEIDLARSTCEHLLKLKLADSSEKGAELSIDVMIGADFYWDFVTREVITGTCGPVAVKTALGWVLSGPLEIEKSRVAHHAMVTTVMTAPVKEIQSEEAMRLDSIVEKFWETEEIAATEVSDAEFMKDFQGKIKFDGSHYSVPLPLKDGIDEIPDNFGLAKGRLFSLLRDLRASKPDILEKYDQLIKQQDIDGYTEIVDPVVHTPGKVHYVPHRPIIRESKSTPIRMICDPSAKMKNNVSLNDCLEPGPSLLPKIFDLLVRNRCFKFALVGDVKSAYMNMHVQEEFRDLLRFMWVSDIHSENPEIVIRRFVSVLHGLNSAPFMLGAVFDNHMNKYADTYQEIIEKFLRDIFMDDLISGAQSFVDVFELYSKCKELMRRGGFRLLKWAVNNDELRAKIKKSETNVFNEPETADADGKQKMVGVSWHVKEDWIESSMDAVIEKATVCKKFTKRFVMKVVASLFDPLGIHSPVMVILKLLLQEVHQLKIDWDVEIPGEIRVKWDNILKNLQKVPIIRIPRFYLQGAGELEDVKIAQVHGFCDASGKAYGCVIYLRLEFEGGQVISRFVASKTRVNPIKLKNTPRLELLSCLLLSNLLKVIKMSLVDIVVHEIFCWTDSMDCFWWINQKEKVWKKFVQTRVQKIRKNIPGIVWNHCPGEINPADIPSRGDYLIKNETKKIWLEGPEFLMCSREDWPKLPTPPEKFTDEANSTVGEKVAVNATLDKTSGISKIINYNNFNSFNRLVLATACVVRFIHNVRAKKKGLQQMAGEITSAEKANARVMWLTDAQLAVDDKKFNQLKVSLGAFRDESDGLIRLRGRLEHSDLDGAAKTPIFVPKESPLNDLIIADAHRKVLHSGMKDTLTEVRTVYWLVRGRAQVKSFLYRCYLCKKYGARLLQKPPAAPLPDVRAQYADPFAVSGVDYLGPLYAYPTPTRKNATLEKVHIVLFTCAVTRAVHLDLVPDVSSAAFVNCLRRFVSRRGIPKLIISDNAKCFLGPELRKYTKDRDIEWQFIMEKSPWWGGFYERMVQVVKRPLRKILRRSHVTYDELLTIITEIEAVVNCRPLCYVYSDDVEETLTPSHLLTGKRLISATRTFPDEIVDETSTTLTNRVRYLRTLIEQYEQKWKHEYLTELREHQRSQNKQPAKELKVGDVVLISDEKLPRNRWRMGKVEEEIRSKDGRVRAVKLRVHSEGRKISFLNRPVNKLCYFEVSSQEDEG